MESMGYVKKIKNDTITLARMIDNIIVETEIAYPLTKHKLELGDYIIVTGEKVFIHMPSSKELILENFKKILDVKDLKAQNLFIKIKKRIDEDKTPENIERYLSFLGYNKYLIYKHDTKIKGEPTKIISKLLTGWKKRDYRRLNLLGLTDKEIYDSGMYPYKLYDMCMKNPFAVPSITIENAEKIYFYNGKKATDDDITYGQLLRTIFLKCRKNSWTSFPISKLSCADLLKDEIKLSYYNMKIKNDNLYYIDNHNIEKIVVNFLFNKISQSKNPPPYFYYECDKTLKVEDKIITLNNKQIEAVENMLNKPISIVTGGPGTGKTTILKKFKELADAKGKSFIVCGPTGKSVSRIKKVVEYKRKQEIGEDCYVTIDRLIYTGFIQPFEYLIIDEFSMVTTQKFKELLECFDHSFKIIFIGDNNQLPPIGWGYLSRELVRCEEISATILYENHRSEDLSLVAQANDFISENYIENKIFKFHDTEYFHNYEIKKYDSDEETSMKGLSLLSLILKKLKDAGLNRDKITIITPTNVDRIICADIFREIFMLNEEHYSEEMSDTNFNQEIKLFIEKRKRMISSASTENKVRGIRETFKLGDKVMNLTNNNVHMIMNGDEGIVREVDESYVIVEIDNENHIFHFNPDKESQDLDVRDLEYGQSKTVHKAQGDEIEYVIAYLPNGGKSFINRNLLYTMLTRAKKEMWFLFDKECLFNGMKNEIGEKYDGIASDIKELFE
jgi:hypothetical protein